MDLERSDPRTNVNPQAIPIPAWSDDFEAINKAISDYNNEALRRFDLMEDEEFTPNLSLVDGLIASLDVNK